MPLLRYPPPGPRRADPRLTAAAVAGWLAPVISERRLRRIERVIRSRLASLTVVLERLHDPHNGAAVLRTCEALGLINVHVVEGPRTPFCFSHRVSQSAHKWLNVWFHRSVEGCLDALHAAGFQSWAAVPPPLCDPRATSGGRAGAAPVETLEARGPLALVFGNEHDGLTPAALARCRRRFSIEQRGFSESLNLSVSVAVALHGAAAARRRALGRAGDLGPAALERLRAGYYALSTPHAVALVERGLRGGA